MRRQIFILVLVIFVIAGCASRVAIRKDYDFNSIKRIAVLSFTGEGVTGRAVADEFLRQLVLAGVDVIESDMGMEKGVDLKLKVAELGVDAFITGTVAAYKPAQNFIVYREKGFGGETVVFGSPVIELGSNRVYRRDNISADDDSFLLFTSASLTVTSRMVDVRSGRIVWANSYTYEGLDIASSIEYTIGYLLNSLRPYWDELGSK